MLLAVLLFNWFGYRLMIHSLHNEADRRLENQLDNNNYEGSELMSIKIPATCLPYYTNSKHFERTNGQIEIDGQSYNFVKWRMYNDSVELFYIPNHTTTKLLTAKNEFFKLVNDLQHSNQPKKNVYNFLGDYELLESFKIHNNNFISFNTSIYYQADLAFHFPAVLENPPERC